MGLSKEVRNDMEKIDCYSSSLGSFLRSSEIIFNPVFPDADKAIFALLRNEDKSVIR
jgi:hypothetical protein